MIVFRLAKEPFHLDLSGKGASIFGGRWNHKGVPMLYTGMSRALCLTECLAHLPKNLLPSGYWMLELSIPGSYITALDAEFWEEGFPSIEISKTIGTQFIEEEKFLSLKVPSKIIKKEFNILLNPMHKGFSEIKIVNSEPFSFDERFFEM